MSIELNCFLHNRFDVVVRDKETEKVKERAEAFNIITDYGWGRIINSAGGWQYIQFGSGTSAPLATDTTLTTRIGGKQGTNVATDLTNLYTTGVIKKTFQIRLEASENVGATISEVGTSRGSATDSVMTKALLKDQNGNPLSIVKTNLDIIDIYATIFAFIPQAMRDGSQDVAVCQFELTTFANSLFAEAMPAGTLKAYPFKLTPASSGAMKSAVWRSGSSLAPIGRQDSGLTPTLTRDAANKKITYSLAQIPATNNVNDCNGVGAIEIAAGVYVGVPNSVITSPTIIKEVIATGDGTTKDFKCKYGGIVNDGNTKLYVNDVEVSATFDYQYPRPEEMGLGWFEDYGWDAATTTRTLRKIISQPITAVNFEGFTTYLYTADSQFGARTLAVSGYYAKAIPAAHQNKEWWFIKLDVLDYGLKGSTRGFVSDPITANLVIHAASAPPSGSTVALTYKPNTLPKGTTTVLNNLSVSILFGDYTP